MSHKSKKRISLLLAGLLMLSGCSALLAQLADWTVGALLGTGVKKE